MTSRRFETGKHRAIPNHAKKPESREKAIACFPWQQNLLLGFRRKKIALPCSCQLCGLAAFLSLSLVTITLATYYPAPSEQLQHLLGPTPPAKYINLAFAVYMISEFFSIILRPDENGSRKFALKQLMFYAAFYIFFWYAGMLQAHFILLTVSGIILQTMESFRRAQSCKATQETF